MWEDYLRWVRRRWQAASLLAAVAAVVVAIIATDIAAGGHSEPPPALGTTYPTGEAGSPRPTRTPRPPTATPNPTTPTVTPTPQPGAADRDVQRLFDLEHIRVALEKYYDEEGSYPTTTGNIQTLCAYEKLDAGCKLTKVLDPLPAADPLGDPLQNGYWYSSDGKSYTIYALQEAPPRPGVSLCEKPESFKQLERVYCVRSTR